MIENSKPEGRILKIDVVKMYLVAIMAGLFFFSCLFNLSRQSLK